MLAQDDNLKMLIFLLFCLLVSPEVALQMGIASEAGRVTLRDTPSTHSRLQWSRLDHGKTVGTSWGFVQLPQNSFCWKPKPDTHPQPGSGQVGQREGSRGARAGAGTLVEITLGQFCLGDPPCGTHRSRANVTLLFSEPSTGISVEFWGSQNYGGLVQTNCNDIKSQEASRVFFPFDVKRESSLDYERDVVSFFSPHWKSCAVSFTQKNTEFISILIL